jgi:hypothetical protein
MVLRDRRNGIDSAVMIFNTVCPGNLQIHIIENND